MQNYWRIKGTKQAILKAVEVQYPEINAILDEARKHVPQLKREIDQYQAAALYALVRPYNFPGARILEIGTAWGYSAAIMAMAAPNAEIITLNPNESEASDAARNLSTFTNVRVEVLKSWEFLEAYSGAGFDVVFVDGDHKRVRMDLPWWEHLNPNGLFLFHDFSPAGTYRECPPVFEAVNEFAQTIMQPLDVSIIDSGGVGMAGFIKPHPDTPMKSAKETYQLGKCAGSSVHSYESIQKLYALAQTVSQVDGYLVECGLTNGGSAAALMLGMNPEKALLFDNFSGIPQPIEPDGAKALYKYTSQPDGWCKGDRAEVEKLFKSLKIPAKKYTIIEGDFSQTVRHHPVNGIALLHVDATLYESTKLVLEHYLPRVVPGGAVIVSAYNHWQGVKKATDEVLAGTDTPLFVFEGAHVFFYR